MLFARVIVLPSISPCRIWMCLKRKNSKCDSWPNFYIHVEMEYGKNYAIKKGKRHKEFSSSSSSCEQNYIVRLRWQSKLNWNMDSTMDLGSKKCENRTWFFEIKLSNDFLIICWRFALQEICITSEYKIWNALANTPKINWK